ncbi:MAG: isoprenyl transferase [Cyanobacteria bacterium]|nr:isoprenyl transferase [Cyanobacteriota bacterium]
MQQRIQQAGIQHIAMIMDGNRRWAKSKHLPAMAGHAQGVESLKKLVRHLSDMGLRYLTVYAFSTENWRRTSEEVDYLLKLFIHALSKELASLHANQVCIQFIGDLEPFPEELKKVLSHSMETTRNNPGLKLQVAINYGSRNELVQAAKRLAEKVSQGVISPQDITEESITQELYTSNIPDPDLLIRTGGESRLSNYLLWQCAYTEFWVTPVPWPDFNEQVLNQALVEYCLRERRFGQ